MQWNGNCGAPYFSSIPESVSKRCDSLVPVAPTRFCLSRINPEFLQIFPGSRQRVPDAAGHKGCSLFIAFDVVVECLLGLHGEPHKVSGQEIGLPIFRVRTVFPAGERGLRGTWDSCMISGDILIGPARR